MGSFKGDPPLLLRNIKAFVVVVDDHIKKLNDVKSFAIGCENGLALHS